MVFLDVDYSDNCADCDFLSDFGDGKYGCVQMVGDNVYGMELIKDPRSRLKNCPIHPIGEILPDLVRQLFQDISEEKAQIDRDYEEVSRLIDLMSRDE